MRHGRFSEEQIIGILKQNEAGAQVTQLCRDHGTRDFFGTVSGAHDNHRLPTANPAF